MESLFRMFGAFSLMHQPLFGARSEQPFYAVCLARGRRRHQPVRHVSRR